MKTPSTTPPSPTPSSTQASPRGRRWFKLALALLMPVLALGLQTLYWDLLQPFVWTLFYPAIFVSSWLGGLVGGLAATALSIALVLWFFMEPLYAFVLQTPQHWASAGVFALVGGLVAAIHHRMQVQTARLEVAQRLAEQARERFQTIFEQAPLGVALIDSLSGQVDEVNQRFADIAGRTRAAMATIDWMQITHPDDVQEDLDNMARLNAGEIPGFQMNKRYLRPDGTPVWISMRIAPLRVAAGERPRHLCMIEDISERLALERTQAEAQEARTRLASEQRWKLALDGVSQGSWDWHLATDTVDYSLGWKAMLGYAEADIGQDLDGWTKRVHPDDLPPTQAAVQAHLAGATPVYESVHRLRCKDGGWKWVLDRGIVFERDANGQPLRMIGTHIDITAHKEAEERLLRSEEHLRLATEGAELGVWYWEMTTQTLNWSERCKVHLGLPPGAEPSVDHFYRAAHPDDRFRVEALINQAVADRSDYAAEYRIRWPDGSQHWLSAHGRVYTYPDGRLHGMGGITQDITERKRHEWAEASRSQMMELLAKGTPLPVVLQAIVAYVEDAKPTCLASILLLDGAGQHLLLGAAPSLPAFYNEAIHGLAIGPDVGSCGAAAWSGRRCIAADLRTHPNWQPFRDLTARAGLGSCWSEPIRGSHGAILGTFALYQREVAEPTPDDLDLIARMVNLTAVAIERCQSQQALADLNRDLERKVVERTAEAQAASAAKSEFLAHMSHEIRTPLNGVLGLVQLLQREPLTPDQQDMVTRIQGAGQSLLAILNDILDFSKIEAGQLRLEDRPFRLDALPAKLDSLLGSVARGKGLALRIAGPDADLGPLRGDALRLEQVLINLVGNAIKFTERGEVAVTFTTLASDPTGVRVRCTVRDSGIGIGPEALGRLFTPFTQADTSTTRRFGGTGLGLAICKRLVELMGGTLGADSVPGAGSTFWFELPLRHAAEEELPAPAAPVPKPPVGPRLRGLHLLAVDDSAMNRELVEMALSREGAQVTLAADGQQAVQLLRASPAGCDAVLMDVQMPVMDGRTATRLIRQELGLTQLPVIALTAGILAEEQRLIREAGADEVLAKPLDLELMVDRLAHHIGATRLATAAARAGTRGGGETGLAATNPAGALAGDQAVASPAVPASPDGDGEPNAVATAVPDIPGIDRERVALTFKDDVEFFLTLLGRLTQEAAAGLVQARQALAAGDRETLALRLHSLKGNAGNVGALTLMAAAGELEAAVKGGAPGPVGAAAPREVGEIDRAGGATRGETVVTDLEAGLADLERQVADLTAASAPWLANARARDRRHEPETRYTQPQPVDTPQIAGQLAALRAALRQHDLSALDLFEDLEDSLHTAWGAASRDALDEAITNLRFASALELLAQVAPDAPPRQDTAPGSTSGGGDPT